MAARENLPGTLYFFKGNATLVRQTLSYLDKISVTAPQVQDATHVPTGSVILVLENWLRLWPQ